MRAAIAAISLLMMGCNLPQTSTSSSPVKSAGHTPKASDVVNQSQFAHLQQEATAMRKDVNNLRVQVFSLQYRISQLESSAAIVSPEDQGYGIAKTPFGAFTVRVMSATPYLDGYKMKLQIGNLTTAAFSGAKLMLNWGPSNYDEQHFTDTLNNSHTKEVDITNLLQPGFFSNVDVVLSPARPQDVKTFSVGLELNQMRLRVR